MSKEEEDDDNNEAEVNITSGGDDDHVFEKTNPWKKVLLANHQ
jgi:hypothetical protein